MTLVSSGEISIGGSVTNRSINLELGRAAGATSNLNETDLRTLAGITTSGAQISLSDFYGKSALAAVLNNYVNNLYNIELERTIVDINASYLEADVSVALWANGVCEYRYSDSYTGTTNFTSFTWLTGGGTNADYYAYMYTPTGDPFTTSSGTATALQLNTDRSWLLRAVVTFNGTSVAKSLNTTLQIRNVGGTALASKTLYMYAEAATVI